MYKMVGVIAQMRVSGGSCAIIIVLIESLAGYSCEGVLHMLGSPKTPTPIAKKFIRRNFARVMVISEQLAL